VLVLALESATEEAGVALADEAGAVASVVVTRGRRHAETLAPAVDFACRRAGVALGDVDAIAVDVGPGLFTGLRVGVATAQGLAFALGLPVVVASSLEVLARAVADTSPGVDRDVVPVVDARRGEVFAARFRVDDGHPVRTGEDALWAPEDLAGAVGARSEPVVLAGDGALRYAALFAAMAHVTPAVPAFAAPPVLALARLAVGRALAGEAGDASTLLPRYLRQADARINWEQRLPPRPAAAGV
jgi:tRNA threonylcarbamoyladenosine biosynthesis protein TsaB